MISVISDGNYSSEIDINAIGHCYFFSFTPNNKNNPAIEAAAINAVHKPALKIPAIAEHPAVKTNKQATKNSNTGFITVSFICLL